VSVAVAITVMLTVQGQHANQDIVCLTIQNVGRTAEIIRLGSVLITLAIVRTISLFQMDCVRIVLMVVVSVLDWETVFSVKAVLIGHGRCNLY
jgi:hypothetical protein